MSLWTLILVTFTTYGATSISNITFTSKNACLAAKTQFDKEFINYSGLVVTTCVERN